MGGIKMSSFLHAFTICVILFLDNLSRTTARGLSEYETSGGASVMQANPAFAIAAQRGSASSPTVTRSENSDSPHYTEDVFFPTFAQLGQVGGMAIDNDGKLHIFHRSSRIWGINTFDHRFHLRDQTPIPNNTIIVVDPITGSELYSWGANLFYMPHGIFVDEEGNTWITDTALHQVLKFPANSNTPSLAIGKKLEPGHDTAHLCQPTDIVLVKPDLVFISDGYCNSRILIYNLQGKFIKEIGANDGMSVPHSLALLPQQSTICVADRENRRVLCYSTGEDENMPAGVLLGEIQGPTLSRMFAIRRRGNDELIAVAGKDFFHFGKPPHGIVFDLTSGTAMDIFSPAEGFSDPHDLAVSLDGESAFVGELDTKAPRRVYKFNNQGSRK